MSFIGKIKNILFEEEEVEEKTPKASKEEIVEQKEVVKKEEKKPVLFDFDEDYDDTPKKSVVKEKKEEETPLFNERSFKYPSFDEEEFESTLPKSKKEVVDYSSKDDYSRDGYVKDNYSRDYRSQKDVYSNQSNKDGYTIRETREVKDISYRKPEKKVEYSSYVKTEEKKKFRPSPIISPVYGIMDKDYVKEDVMPKKKEEPVSRHRDMSFESVRKKAFGSLEDEIEETITTPSEEYIRDVKEELEEKPIRRYKEEARIEKKEEKKNVDDLLKDTVHEEIVVPTSLDEDYENKIDDIEDELEKYDEVMEEKHEKEIEKGNIPKKELDELEDLDKRTSEIDEDDTLEQDLFELIDSMYDDRKEGAE